MFSSWVENFSFHYILQHFSPFYICCIAVSLATVVFTWYFNDSSYAASPQALSFTPKSGFTSEFNKYHMKNYDFNVMSQMKRAKQKAIEKILRDELTEEQLAQEKEIESKQLSEIFKLLQDQEDKFHINTQEELQEQLKLYRSQ